MAKKEVNKNDKIYKNYVWNQTGMLVQFILLFFLFVFGIITIFHHEFKLACFLVMTLILLVMAYNNHRIYKRKYLTIIYIVGALLVFLSSLEMILGK